VYEIWSQEEEFKKRIRFSSLRTSRDEIFHRTVPNECLRFFAHVLSRPVLPPSALRICRALTWKHTFPYRRYSTTEALKSFRFRLKRRAISSKYLHHTSGTPCSRFRKISFQLPRDNDFGDHTTRLRTYSRKSTVLTYCLVVRRGRKNVFIPVTTARPR